MLHNKYDRDLLKQISMTGPQSLYSSLVSDYCELQNFCECNWNVFEQIAIVCHNATLLLRGRFLNKVTRVDRPDLFITYVDIIIHSISKVPFMKMKIIEALAKYRDGKRNRPECKNKPIESLQTELAYFIALKSWSQQTFLNCAKERYKNASEFLEENKFQIIVERIEIGT